MSARKLAAFVSICADLLEANVAVSILVSLHWWQIIEELFTDTASLWLLLLVSTDEEHWHSTGEHLLHHASSKGVLASLSHVHLIVVRVVNVDRG